MWQLPHLSIEEILIYLRKSRTDDPALTVEEVLSKHEQMLNEWVQRNMPDAGPIPEENRYREVVSGETIDSRPQVKELLRRIESPRIKAILIVEPQRLSRGDLEDIGRLVKLLRYTNTIVITMQYTYDLQDERDRDAFERELKRGNEFLEYQKRIMGNGKLLAVENGYYIANKPPYGYDRLQIKEGRRTCYTLTPNPEQAPVVKLVFEMYAAGESSHGIARRLNEMGIPTAKGGKWSAESLKSMRCNQHYIGMVRWNHRRTVKSIENGELVKSRPLNEQCLVYPGKHEAIIDKELWDAVQEIRDKIPKVKRGTKCTNPFAGLVRCQCGSIMPRRTYRRGVGGPERSAPRLICSNQSECGTASCTVDEMVAEVSKVLKDTMRDYQLKIKHNASDVVAIHRKNIERLERRIDDLNRLEASQWKKYTEEGMPKHIFDQLNSDVLKERAEVQEALFQAQSVVPEPIDYQHKVDTLHGAIELLEDPSAPAIEQNMMLKRCIESITYNRAMKTESGNRRWGEPAPIELCVKLKI